MEVETPHVGPMLALCWRIFGSGTPFFHSWLPLGRLWGVFCSCWSFLGVLGRSGSDFEASRNSFGGSETSFFNALSPAKACNLKNLLMGKNHSCSQVFVWFLHIASFVLQPQNDAKSFPEPVEQSFLRRWCSKRILAWILRGFGALLSVTWPAFVRSWAAPGLSWVLLRRLWGTSWALLAVSWLFREASVLHFDSQERPRP